MNVMPVPNNVSAWLVQNRQFPVFCVAPLTLSYYNTGSLQSSQTLIVIC